MSSEKETNDGGVAESVSEGKEGDYGKERTGAGIGADQTGAEIGADQTGAETGADQTGAETGAPSTELLLASLEPAEWHYPDDCYYIKMYVLCPLRNVEDALGPAHNSPDMRRWNLFCF